MAQDQQICSHSLLKNLTLIMKWQANITQKILSRGQYDLDIYEALNMLLCSECYINTYTKVIFFTY